MNREGYLDGKTLWSESRDEISGGSQEGKTLLFYSCGESTRIERPIGPGVKGIPLADVQLAEH